MTAFGIGGVSFNEDPAFRRSAGGLEALPADQERCMGEAMPSADIQAARRPRLDQIVAATQAVIAMATEYSSGNAEADAEVNQFADGLRELAEERLEHGAAYVLAVAERERAAAIAEDVAQAEARWSRLHLGRAA